MTEPNPDDFFALVERVVRLTEEAGEEEIEMPTHVVRALLELARRATRSRRGRPSLPGRVEICDIMTVYAARRLKKNLLAEAKAEGRPMTADQAARQAAEETSKESRLSAAGIRARMDRRFRR